MKALCLLSVLLCLHYCMPLPVRNAQVKEKQDNNIPGLNLEDYMKYWEEMASNDPSKPLAHSHRHWACDSVCLALLEKLSKVRDMDMGKLRELIARNPHLQERIIQSNERGDVRNQMDEAKRMTVEEMRQLQK